MTYEITYILKPELTVEEQESANLRVAEIISSLGGKAETPARTFSVERGGTDENNLRKFAYPIRHYRQGYYYTNTFELEGTKLKELDAILSREEQVLRFLVVKDFTPLSKIPVKEQTPKSESEVKKSDLSESDK